MFKRIRAKQAKRQRKDDPEAQETFNDIISDDSDSDDSDSEDDSSSDSESGEAKLGGNRQSVADALSNPIFGSDLDEATRSCAVCPGVLLKNSHMTETHLNSKVGKLLVQSYPRVRPLIIQFELNRATKDASSD